MILIYLNVIYFRVCKQQNTVQNTVVHYNQGAVITTPSQQGAVLAAPPQQGLVIAPSSSANHRGKTVKSPDKDELIIEPFVVY